MELVQYRVEIHAWVVEVDPHWDQCVSCVLERQVLMIHDNKLDFYQIESC